MKKNSIEKGLFGTKTQLSKHSLDCTLIKKSFKSLKNIFYRGKFTTAIDGFCSLLHKQSSNFCISHKKSINIAFSGCFKSLLELKLHSFITIYVWEKSKKLKNPIKLCTMEQRVLLQRAPLKRYTNLNL